MQLRLAAFPHAPDTLNPSTTPSSLSVLSPSSHWTLPFRSQQRPPDFLSTSDPQLSPALIWQASKQTRQSERMKQTECFVEWATKTESERQTEEEMHTYKALRVTLEQVIRQSGKCVNKTGYHHVGTGFSKYKCVCVCGTCRLWGDKRGDAWCHVSVLIMALLAQFGWLEVT